MSDYVPTYMRWYNSEEGSKVASADVGSYEDIPFGAQRGGEKHAAGKLPHPEHGEWQWGLACSKTARTIMIDIDAPERWKEGCAFVELGDIGACATSYRSDLARFHVWVVVPEELMHLWPRQGPTLYGDIKSNGFSYHTGVHYSGLTYDAAGNPMVTADAGLLNALTADRIFPQGRGATGVMAGPWEDDAYRIGSHDECVATVMSMVNAGLPDTDIHARLDVIMPNRDGDWPERHAYIEEKIRSAERKIDERDAREQDFWGGFHGGGYAGLVGELQSRVLAAAAAATPRTIAADTIEWTEHQVRSGGITSEPDLALCLNPRQRPFEPRSGTDKLNALDLLETGQNFFRFAADEGCWVKYSFVRMVWEPWGTKSEKQEIGRSLVSAFGTYLKTDEQLAEELAAQGTASSEEQIEQDNKRKKALVEKRGKYMNSQGQGSIATALITEARMTERYSVMAGNLDTEPDVLWAGGYPWSLRHPVLTLATDVRQVSLVHMKTAATLPVPGPTPAFDQVLAAVWPEADVRSWALREIAGVMLWGSTSKMHPILDGPPGGGKSTFALILTTVLGSYAVQVSPDKILGADASSAHEEEVAAMIGARMVWMDEPPPGGKQSISRFNDLASGTGKISAAKKFMNRVSAPKLFNFLICQNPRNGLRMDAQGVGERMTFIPCHGLPEATRAAWERWKLEGEAEYPAVLARLITECALFHSGDRLPTPLGAQFARGEAQERADEFASWMLEYYEVLPAEMATVDTALFASPTLGSLRTQYNDTCARPNRQPVITAPEARDQLTRLGIKIAPAAGNKERRRRDVVYVKSKGGYQGGY